MPQEYKNTYSNVFCNDCEKKSHAKFHFIYHKCGHCLGYNTKVITTTPGPLPEGAVIAPEILSVGIERIPSLVSSNESSGDSVGSDEYPTSGIWCHQCQVIFSINY